MATFTSHEFTPCVCTLEAHTASLLSLSQTHSQSAPRQTCHPCNHQQAMASVRGACAAAGATVEGKWSKRRMRKMRVTVLKLVLSEKVTDDLMLAVTSPCHRNQVTWQSLLTSTHFILLCFSCSFIYFLLKISQFFSLFSLKLASVKQLGSKI